MKTHTWQRAARIAAVLALAMLSTRGVSAQNAPATSVVTDSAPAFASTLAAVEPMLAGARFAGSEPAATVPRVPAGRQPAIPARVAARRPFRSREPD
jgi:hypothetical protein